MIDLSRQLEEYLRIRRSLGFKLERDGKLLAQFIGYLHDQDADAITIDHAVAWVGLPPGAGRGWLAFRMSVVRGFLGYLHTLDPAVPVPPADLFPSGPHRAVPYLYSDDELAALVAATDTLRYPLQRTTYRTLICLLAVTGRFSGGPALWRRLVSRVCAAQRLMGRTLSVQQVWCKWLVGFHLLVVGR
ncbi:MAG: hypothetical protein ACRDQ9_13325 [Pseudonocardiaceae bacterium]